MISSPVGAELELQYSSSSNEYGKFLCSVVIFISFAMAGICQYVSYYSVKLIPYLYIYIYVCDVYRSDSLKLTVFHLYLKKGVVHGLREVPFIIVLLRWSSGSLGGHSLLEKLISYILFVKFFLIFLAVYIAVYLF